jgi:hypothetical protein
MTVPVPNAWGMAFGETIAAPDRVYFITFRLPSDLQVFGWFDRNADVSGVFAFAKTCVTKCKSIKLFNMNRNEFIENKGTIKEAVRPRDGRNLDARYIIQVTQKK